jgi:hypothetical protein
MPYESGHSIRRNPEDDVSPNPFTLDRFRNVIHVASQTDPDNIALELEADARYAAEVNVLA